SRKTQQIIESALEIDDKPVLVTTYTNENRHQILNRITSEVGFVPPNIAVLGWFSFLIGQCARPYQRSLTGNPSVIRGLNFKGRRNRYTKKSNVRHYYFDKSADMYRDGVSEFVCQVNGASEGAV